MFKIGQVFIKTYPIQAIEWCNENNCYMETIEPTSEGISQFKITEQKEFIPYVETEEERKARIAQLKLTKREVFLGIYKAKQITPEQIRAQITDTEALIEFDYANDYYRGNPLINSVGATLGFTEEQLDNFFMTKDYTTLL